MAGEDVWIKFERDLNAALEERESQYRVVYLPPRDLMPYEDLERATKIRDAAERMLDEWRESGDNEFPLGNLVVNREWTKTISMALAVYKACLFAYHGERLRKEIKAAAGSEDSQ